MIDLQILERKSEWNCRTKCITSRDGVGELAAMIHL
jgi:hypothetical protein